MQPLELTAKSVDEATKAAAAKLGVSPQTVKITVLEETKGLFGRSNVRVRAEVVEAPSQGEPEAKPAKGRGRTAKQPEPMAAVQEAFEAPAPEAVAEAALAEKKPRGRTRKETAKPEPAADAGDASEEQEAGGDVVATAKDAEDLTALVREVLDAAGLQVSAQSTSVSGRYVSVQLDGKDAAFLVGKHGEVLNAMQYLLNIMAGRRFGNGVRITLDGNDYRRRREDQLTKLATSIAEQVRKRGEEAVLDALPAFERRIVHKALSELTGVQTYSEGEEPNRRVVIAPAD